MKIYRNNKYYDFYMPCTKFGLVRWLSKYYSHSKKEEKINWNTKGIKQLRVIYINRQIEMEDIYEQEKKGQIS